MPEPLLRRFRPDGFTLLLAVLAALGSALILVRILAHGPWMSGDAIYYVAMARNLLDGEGFLGWNGLYTALWPPLFPMLLAAAAWPWLDPLEVAGPFNALVFGLIILVVGCWLRQRIESRLLVVWACLAIMLLLPAVALTAHFAWSEPTFILFATLALLHTDRFLSGAKRRALFWAAGFAALACLTRYIGVTLIAAVMPLLLLQSGPAFPERLRRTAIFLLIAAAPLCFWLLSNHLHTGMLFGPRDLSGRPPLTNVQLALEVAATWTGLFKDGAGTAAAVRLAAVLGLAALALVVLALVRWRRQPQRPGLNFVLVNGAFAGAYLACILGVVSSVALTPLDNRYLSPAFAPLLLIGALALDRALKRSRRWTLALPKGVALAHKTAAPRKGVRTAVLPPLLFVLLCCWTGYVGYRTLSWALAGATGPAEVWTARYWKESPIFEFLRTDPQGGAIFNNGRTVAQLFHFDARAQGRARNKLLPSQRWNLLEQLRPGDYVVWLHHVYLENSGARDYGLADLLHLPQLALAAEFADGLIFKARRHDEESGPAPPLMDLQALLAVEPTTRSTFDLHLHGRTLTYAKASCTSDDAKARFFLHVFPKDVEDPAFPQERRQWGYDNLDFDFNAHGVMQGQGCVVKAVLPPYPIERILTGQFIRGQGRLWSAEVVPGEPT